MKIIDVCSALNSERRLKILKRLAEEPLSAIDVFKKLKSELGLKNRESVYKALEQLNRAGILKKVYHEKEKKLKYELIKNKLEIDLIKCDVN